MYKLYKTSSGDLGVQFTNDDGSQISFLQDPANTDYQQYLKWLEEGNTPLPADTPEE
jgi:hypothetical protein